MSTEKSARQRAAEAGVNGKVTQPLSYAARHYSYEKQNALAGRIDLTDRQRRQLRRMGRRAAA